MAGRTHCWAHTRTPKKVSFLFHTLGRDPENMPRPPTPALPAPAPLRKGGVLSPRAWSIPVTRPYKRTATPLCAAFLLSRRSYWSGHSFSLAHILSQV